MAFGKEAVWGFDAWAVATHGEVVVMIRYLDSILNE
jgi:hypothetical protein